MLHYVPIQAAPVKGMSRIIVMGFYGLRLCSKHPIAINRHIGEY